MRTPIADFVKEYAKKQGCRFHMPGHKGQTFLGCEAFDITEIAGADALYEANGIIAESEENASELFGTAKTVYSTEGSSQCIKAMMHLVVGCSKKNKNVRPYVIASRNVHKAFLYAATLVDFDVVWLYPDEMHSLCSCVVEGEQLESVLKEQIKLRQGERPAAVYITSPDYLGGSIDILVYADICHRYDTVLAVDNAHGAYLHFLDKPIHPIDLGADICCDSAHKTLPVLTGGAYLQISKKAPDYFVENAKSVMALYGSTSPSYLTLSSLDLCNRYLEEGYFERLEKTISRIDALKEELRENGWQIEISDPLKVTISVSGYASGHEVADFLRNSGVECEYADEDYVVLMMTLENTEKDYKVLKESLISFEFSKSSKAIKGHMRPVHCEQKLSIREAFFAMQENVSVENSFGRICGIPSIGCPPAIPIVVPGEEVNKAAVELLKYYGIKTITVVKKS